MAGLLNTGRPDPADVTQVETVVTNDVDGEMVEAPVEDITAIARDDEDPNDYDDDDQEPNVTDEEQMEYRTFVETSFELIYADGKVNEGIVAMLDDDPADLIAVLGEIPELEAKFSPIVALGATAALVTMEVVKRSETPPSDEVIFHAGRAILEDLGNLATTDFDQDQMNQAMYIAVDIYRLAGEQDGLVDKEVASEAFAELLNAQDEGREDEIVPGLSRFRNGDR